MARKNRVSVYDGVYHVTTRIAKPDGDCPPRKGRAAFLRRRRGAQPSRATYVHD